MSRLRIACIVAGHGEVTSLPILLARLWYAEFAGEFLDIVRPPIRQPRDRLAQNKDDALVRAVELAAAKLKGSSIAVDSELILVLIDADDDLPCELGPKLVDIARDARPDKSISCVIANVEYETWFVACARSLSRFLELEEGEIPNDPESERMGKGWVEKRFRGVKYSETVDQAKMTAHMDLQMCRKQSKSFDKLCRDVESAIETA